MAINLQKGGRINLAKEAPGLKNLLVRLNWQANNTSTGTDFDLDSSVFMCQLKDLGDGNGPVPQIIADDYFIFYNNTTSPDGAIVHSGDDKTGGQGEELTIDMTKLDPRVEQISFVVTIHESDVRRQNFGQVPRSSITLINADSGVEIAKYSLGDDFSTETALEFGSIYKRDDGAWAFNAVGNGHNLGLAAFVQGFGGNV